MTHDPTTAWSPPPWKEEIHRESLGERWCHHCRKRVQFIYRVTRPVDPMSYYGPKPSIRCEPKGHIDGDCFPGLREWEE